MDGGSQGRPHVRGPQEELTFKSRTLATYPTSATKWLQQLFHNHLRLHLRFKPKQLPDKMVSENSGMLIPDRAEIVVIEETVPKTPKTPHLLFKDRLGLL